MSGEWWLWELWVLLSLRRKINPLFLYARGNICWNMREYNMKVFLQVILLDAVWHHLVNDILFVRIVLSIHWQQKRSIFQAWQKGTLGLHSFCSFSGQCHLIFPPDRLLKSTRLSLVMKKILFIPYSFQNHAEIIAVLYFGSTCCITRFQIQSLFSFCYEYNDTWSGAICPYIEVSGA